VIEETSAQPMLHSYDNYYNNISEGYDSDDIELKPTTWLIDHHLHTAWSKNGHRATGIYQGLEITESVRFPFQDYQILVCITITGQ
jgi:hypothetical protein